MRFLLLLPRRLLHRFRLRLLPVRRLQLVHGVYLVCSKPLAAELEAAHARELLHLHHHGLAEAVQAAEHHLQTRERLVGEQHQAALAVAAHVVLLTRICLEPETLDVGQLPLVGIIEHRRPHLPLVVLLDDAYVGVVMVGKVEARGIEIAVVQHHQYMVAALELAQVLPAPVVVQAQYVAVEPHLASAKRGAAVLLQGYLVHGQLRQYLAHGAPSLHGKGTEILLEDDAAHPRVGAQRHLDHFGLAVGVGREVGHARARRALRQVILPVAYHAGHGKALHVARAVLALAVHHVVDGAAVVLFEHVQVENVLAHKLLLGHRSDDIAPVAEEHNHVVQVGTARHEFITFQPGAYKALGTVHVKLLVGLHHLRRVYGVEAAQLRAPRVSLAVALLERAEPLHGVLHNV